MMIIIDRNWFHLLEGLKEFVVMEINRIRQQRQSARDTKVNGIGERMIINHFQYKLIAAPKATLLYNKQH